jgi:DNA-binding transcriptional regulator YdaS (Cro superfamily)
MHVRRAVAAVGNQSALARRMTEVGPLPVSPQQINNWLRTGSVPADYCPQVEVATNSLVRCEQLNDRVRWDALRATA